MKRVRVRAILLAIIIGLLAGVIWVYYLQNHTNEATLKKDILLKQLKLDELNGKSGEMKKQTEQLIKEKQELEKQLQSKRQEAERIAQAKLVVTQVASAAPVSSNEAKAFIYQHESGNRTTAVNSIGCRGLGQACPGSKLPCGDDYACQDAWFTNYMLQRYGTWENAKAFWVSHRWW